MTLVAGLLVSVALLAALVDWWSVWRDRRDVERIAKPTTMVALVGVALTVEAPDPRLRAAIVVGLVFSLLGDVALVLDRFLPGVAAFGLAQVSYVVGFLPLPRPAWLTVAAIAVVAVFLLTIGRRVVRGAGGVDGRLRGPVAGYMLLLGTMVATAVSTASPLLVAGSLLFATSDTLNGWRRFVGPPPGGRVAVHVTYHLGQACLALAVAGIGSTLS